MRRSQGLPCESPRFAEVNLGVNYTGKQKVTVAINAFYALRMDGCGNFLNAPVTAPHITRHGTAIVASDVGVSNDEIVHQLTLNAAHQRVTEC